MGSGGKTRAYRTMVVAFTVIITIVFGTVVLVNFLVDPLWLFSHTNLLNKIQLPINERAQKTNYLAYGGADYDTLIIGNSRATLINQNDLNGKKAFNYSVSAIATSEYEDYIAFALKRSGGKIKTVYISSSFASANIEVQKNIEKTPDYYISKSQDTFYRLSMLMSLNMFRYSLRTLKENLYKPKKGVHYDRNNVAYIIPFEKSGQDYIFIKDINAYDNIYTNVFRYDRDDFRSRLNKIVAANPTVRFVAFSLPVTTQMHCLVKKAGLATAYEEWITDMVDVFGSLHHFEYIHSVADDRANFMDANHFYPEVGTMIMNRMQVMEKELPGDFGILINRDNLERQLVFLRKNLELCQ